MIRKMAAFAALFAMSSAALAAPKVAIYPMQVGAETARYRQGVATLDLETPTAAVQLTPREMDHGSLAFDVAVYNKSASPFNFDVTNVKFEVGAEAVTAFSKDELVDKAKNRAMWSQIGIAVLAGAAAAAASQAHTTETYRSRTFVPGLGTIHHVATWRDNSIGQLGAAASVVGGAVAIKGVQDRLDYTVANLSDEVVQMTTIDGDSSYAGRVVARKLKAKMPFDVKVTVDVAGVPHVFAFRVTKPGVNVPPAFTVLTKAVVEDPKPQPAIAPAAAPAPTISAPAVIPAVATQPAPAITPTAMHR